MDRVALRDARNLRRAAAGVGLAYGLHNLYQRIRDAGNAYLVAEQLGYHVYNRFRRIQDRVNALRVGRMEIVTEDRMTSKRKHTNTDDTVPSNGVLRGSNLTLGPECVLTRDYLRYGKLRRGRRNNVVSRGVFIFQGINRYDLSSRRYDLGVDYSTASVTLLPVYAFNLSAIAFQGQGSISQKQPKYRTMPFYRLKKTNDLATGTKQYDWYAIEGDKLDGTGGSYSWHKKKVDDYTYVTSSYRHMWSNIKLMLQCGNCDCIVHTDIVKFRNGCGPLRQYDDYGATAITYDAEVPSRQMCHNDVFWESYLAHRNVHPLAEYTNVRKEKNIVTLAKGQITVNRPEYGVPAVRHIRNVFVADGKGRNLRDVTFFDQTSGLTATEDVVAQPINGAHAAAAVPWDYPMKTNTDLGFFNTNVYGENREEDVWLFVHADMYPPRSGELASPCSFDLKVLNKYEWEKSASTTPAVAPIVTG